MGRQHLALWRKHQNGAVLTAGSALEEELHIDVDAGRSGNVQHRGLHIEELTGGSQIDRDGAGAGIIDLEALGDIALAQAVEDVVDSLVFLSDVHIGRVVLNLESGHGIDDDAVGSHKAEAVVTRLDAGNPLNAVIALKTSDDLDLLPLVAAVNRLLHGDCGAAAAAAHHAAHAAAVVTVFHGENQRLGVAGYRDGRSGEIKSTATHAERSTAGRLGDMGHALLDRPSVNHPRLGLGLAVEILHPHAGLGDDGVGHDFGSLHTGVGGLERSQRLVLAGLSGCK